MAARPYRPAPPMPHVDGVRHRDVQVRGVRLHVAEAGPAEGEPADGPPILLLHGWPQHWYIWRHVIGPLSQTRRVIAPDLRGFGWSDAPRGTYAKQVLADDVLALLDELGIARVDLAAHDWGAWVGFILALDHPDRIAHYLALGILPPWPDPPAARDALQAWRLLYQVVLATPGIGSALLERTDIISRAIPGGAFRRDAWTPADLALFADPLRDPAHARASSMVYRTFLTHEARPFLAGQWNDRRLTVPTILLIGRHDPVIREESLGPWRAHADDMVVEVREDAGHFVPEEIPDTVVAYCRSLFAA